MDALLRIVCVTACLLIAPCRPVAAAAPPAPDAEDAWSGEAVSPEAAWRIGWPQNNGPTGNLIPLPTTTAVLDDLSLGRLAWISETTDFGTGKLGSKGFAGDRYTMRLGVEGTRVDGEQPGNWAGPIVYEGMVFGESFVPAGEVLTGRWDNKPVKYHVEADVVTVAVDARTGRTVWRAVEPGGLLVGGGKRGGFQVGLAAADGKVFVMGPTGRLFAYDVADGRRVWQSDIGAAHRQMLAIRDKQMEAARAGGEAVDIHSPKWHCSMVVADDVLVAPNWRRSGGYGVRDTGLDGYDVRTGRRLWSVEPLASPYATPALARIDGRTFVLAGGAQGRLSLIDPQDGRVLWRVEGLGPNIANLSTDGVYVLVNVKPADDDRTPGYWGCYRYDRDGARRLWAFPEEADYQISTWFDNCARMRYLVRDGLVYAACHGDGKASNGVFVVADAETGKVLASHRNGRADADAIREMFYLVGDRLWVRSDSSHGPTHGGRHPLLPWRAGPEGVERLDDAYGMCGNDAVEFTTAYETLMEAPIVDGRKFERVDGGRVACVDLRKFADDRTWQLQLEGGWVGAPRALPVQFRVVGGNDIVAGKSYPPEAAALGLVYTMQRREPGWQPVGADGLAAAADRIRGEARLSSGTDDSVPVALDIALADGRITGRWSRKIEGAAETRKTRGEITGGGWSAERVFYPTPWLTDQPRTEFGNVPPGGRCVVITADALLPRGDDRRDITLVLVHDGERFVSGGATAFTYNQAWHEVDASRLSLDGGKLRGEAVVILHGDRWVGPRYPDDSREPRAGRLVIDARLGEDGGIAGRVEGEWGVAYEAQGPVTGTASATR